MEAGELLGDHTVEEVREEGSSEPVPAVKVGEVSHLSYILKVEPPELANGSSVERSDIEDNSRFPN